MSALLEQLQQLQQLDSNLHWFCGVKDGTKNYKTGLPHKQEAPLSLVVSCFQVFAYDYDEVEQQKDFVIKGLDRHLGKCEDCVVLYYKTKRKFLEQLQEEYNDEDVEVLAGIFYEHELHRIQLGLRSARDTLDNLAPGKRSASALKEADKFAIVEALTCARFLENPDNVMKDLHRPFMLILKNEDLEVKHYIPAIPNFLLRDDGIFRDWAKQAMLGMPKLVEKDDFDFAFRAVLERMIGRSLVPPFEPSQIRRLWIGLEIIVDRFSKDIITHSLRALDVDVYRAALEHLQVNDESVRYILQTITALLLLSPRDFWEAMGAIGPITVGEQIFRSPKFDEIMLDARAGDSSDTSAALFDVLAWIVPFMDSLLIGQKPSVCRSILEQLLSRCKSTSVSAEARSACWKEALRLLAATLTACDEKSDLTDAVGRAVAADALNCGNAFIHELLEILDRPDDDKQAATLMPYCVTSIEITLALESKVLYNDRLSAAEGKRNGANLTHAPVAWRTVAKKLHRNNLNLAKAILGATNSLLALERIHPGHNNDKPSPEQEAINRSLQELFDLVTQVLERINYFDVLTLRRFSQVDSTVTHLTTALSAAEPGIHESVLEVMKSMTGESFRSDALRTFLKQSLHATLDGMTAAASRIAYLRNFGSCSRFLKVSTDILNALCDSQDGILRSLGEVSRTDVAALKHFWINLWSVLKMMYECSEGWNNGKVAISSILKEFVRDIMQFSGQLFDQFNVFNYAITKDEPYREKDPTEESASKMLLRATADATGGIIRYLKLRDEYLLRNSVELVRKLLVALTRRELELPTATTDFLIEVSIFNGAKDPDKKIGTRTLLGSTDLAGIEQDLEANAGHAIVQEARDRALLEKGLIPDDDDDDDDVPLVPGALGSALRQNESLTLQHKKKQGTIDIGAWGVRAESDRDLERVAVPDSKAARAKEPSRSAAPSTFDRKTLTKPITAARSPAAQQAFLNERKKAKEEAERRRVAVVARIKKGIPGLQTDNQGSGLSKLGKLGKDHGPKGEAMMVSSDSESDSDDEIDKELFRRGPSKTPAAIAEYNASRKAQMVQKGPIKKARIQRSAKDMRARLAPSMTGLYAKFLAWDFFYDGSFPPGTSKNDYSFVSDKFRTAADYKRAFETLLLLEAWSSFCKAREEAAFRAFEVKVANRISVDSLFEVSVTIDQAVFKEAGIHEADIILLSNHSKPTESAQHPHCLGRISKIRRKKGSTEMTVQIASSGASMQSWATQNAALFAVKIESMITLEREYGALSGLEWYDLCQEIIQAEISPILKYNEAALQRLMRNFKLNTAQARAVQSAIDNDAFTLIQGPPGSGKTKTIVAIVGALLTESLRTNNAVSLNRPDTQRGQMSANAKKLLVCAPSNAAVDELVMRFMDGVKTVDGAFHKPKVVRLGRSDKVNPQVLSVTLDEQIDKILNPYGEKVEREATELDKAINAHKAADKELKEMHAAFDEANAAGKATAPELSKQFEQLKRSRQSWSNAIERLRDSGNTAMRDVDIKRRQAEGKVLADAHIICATLSGSARETFQHLTMDFETVVIDEAAQCIELSALIPLKYGCSKCIMVGDPKQLPPTVLSREAARFQYEQSLFVRMQRNHPDEVHLLDTQYRMHPEISRFPSSAFYEGRLLDGPDMAALRTQPWHVDPLLGPYRFYDVAGRHEAAPKGHSLVNNAEVEIAIELYKRLIQSCRRYDFRGKIGVITPYKSQLRLLGDRFSRVFGEDIRKAIEFNTTDAFQGRESEIIIFSCVRASDRGIGFLADIRRMNVGITRAKSSLWVLGNSASLLQGEFWGAMIRDAQARGLCTSGQVGHVLRESPKVYSDTTGKPSEALSRPPVPPRKTLDAPSMPNRPPSVDVKMSSSSNSSSESSSDSDAPIIKIKKKSNLDIEADIVMSGTPTFKQEVKTELKLDTNLMSGTSTPKRKRSSSPTNDVLAAVKSGSKDRESPTGSSKDGDTPKPPARNVTVPVRPPAPRPRKPADAMFIKPKKRK